MSTDGSTLRITRVLWGEGVGFGCCCSLIVSYRVYTKGGTENLVTEGLQVCESREDTDSGHKFGEKVVPRKVTLGASGAD